MISDKHINLPIYKKLVSGFFHDVVKAGANPYTIVNGNMYSFLDDQGRVCLRMSEYDLARFSSNFGTHPVVQNDAVLEEYVAVSEALLSHPEALSEAFMMCFEYAVSLPAK